jgi:hypothetical protein
VNAQGTFDEDIADGRSTPRYGVSVRAMELGDTDSETEVVDFLCSSTKLGGKSVAVLTLANLSEGGYVLVSDPTKEDPHHHLIGQGNLQQMPDTSKLSLMFSNARRENPAWTKRKQSHE